MAKQKSKIVEELKRRAEKEEFTLEKFCFDKQLAFIKDTSKFKTAVCSRRAGKSVACAADLVYTSLNQPGDVAYLTLNRRSAKRIIWRALLEILDNHSIRYKPDNVDLSIKLLDNNNIIYVSPSRS